MRVLARLKWSHMHSGIYEKIFISFTCSSQILDHHGNMYALYICRNLAHQKKKHIEMHCGFHNGFLDLLLDQCMIEQLIWEPLQNQRWRIFIAVLLCFFSNNNTGELAVHKRVWIFPSGKIHTLLHSASNSGLVQCFM